MSEIKEHLEKAQNPLFFFDDDDDGLTSFLILRRFLGRGRGVSIKSFPDLNASYHRKIQELKPDYVFILDKPAVSQEFFNKVKQDNIPIVWIDHHNVEKPLDQDIHYYNTYHNENKNEPVCYLCYKIANKKEDIWLAVIGCISDCFMPDFYLEFYEKYPGLGKKEPKEAFDLLYNTEIGKIARILDFALKDTTTNVVNMIRFLMNIQNPYDILEENFKTKQILARFEQIDSKYQALMEKARKFAGKKMIYFQYGGNLSLSSNLANQLTFEFPDKVIFVVYLRGDIANISIRGKINVRDITIKALEGIEGATGGGHEHATGARMSVSDLPRFREKVEAMVGKRT